MTGVTGPRFGAAARGVVHGSEKVLASDGRFSTKQLLPGSGRRLCGVVHAKDSPAVIDLD